MTDTTATTPEELEEQPELDRRGRRIKCIELIEAGGATRDGLIEGLGLDDAKQLTRVFGDVRQNDLFPVLKEDETYELLTYEENAERAKAAPKKTATPKGRKPNFNNMEQRRSTKAANLQRKGKTLNGLYAKYLENMDDAETRLKYQVASLQRDLAHLQYNKVVAVIAGDLKITPAEVAEIKDLDLHVQKLKEEGVISEDA